jgi:2-iminoacetate synthase ThiH
MTRSDFERIIRESGREPFERDSEYRRVARRGASVLPLPLPLPVPA